MGGISKIDRAKKGLEGQHTESISHKPARRRCSTDRDLISDNCCCVGIGEVRDGQGEKVRESLKQVHYNYKNRLEEYDAKI